MRDFSTPFPSKRTEHTVTCGPPRNGLEKLLRPRLARGRLPAPPAYSAGQRSLEHRVRVFLRQSVHTFWLDQKDCFVECDTAISSFFAPGPVDFGVRATPVGAARVWGMDVSAGPPGSTITVSGVAVEPCSIS